jgi:hypothetical protein|nr:MAG TPA: hypothetical protein [Caudoviricetes sp.]
MDKVLSGMIVVNFAVFWFFLGVLLSNNAITLLNGKIRKENVFLESSDKKSVDDVLTRKERKKLEQLDELLNYQLKGGGSDGD